MADNVKINSTLVSGRKDKTLTYTQYVMDETSKKGLDEILSGVRYKSVPITTKDIENNAITIAKIAQEVWDRIKAEYLSINGNNHMNANLHMNNHEINLLKGIRTDSLGVELHFNEDGHSVIVGAENTDGSQEPIFFPFLYIDDGELKVVDGYAEAEGYRTSSRSELGLLANDGSVATAMTDTDVDGVLKSVFNS